MVDCTRLEVDSLVLQLVKRTLECGRLDKLLPFVLDTFYRTEPSLKSVTEDYANAFRVRELGSLLFAQSIVFIMFLSSETSVVRAATSGEIPGDRMNSNSLWQRTALFRELRIGFTLVNSQASRGSLSKKFSTHAGIQ
ncbi:hypothetical protein Tco_0889444 [Tanacetum coccineum]